MKKKVAALLLVVVAVFMLVGNVMAEDSAASQTWKVAVGKETDSTSIDAMLPRVTYVHEGDKVEFTNGAKITPHTVTFLGETKKPLLPTDPAHAVPSADSGVSWDGKALLNSGILLPGQKYEVVFPKSGVYSFYCVLHPMMTGTIVVIPKGQPIPDKIAQAADAKWQENELLLQAQLLDGSNASATYTKNNDGSLTYSIGMGSAHSTLSHNKNMPDLVVVSAGDSVEWMNMSPYEPHFVTFNKPADLNFFTEKGEFNPAFLAPSGKTAFDGTGFTNSGIMMPGTKYSLKFTKPGTYKYECYLHSGSKMTGTIVVVPKDAIKLVVNGKAVADSAGAEWKNGDIQVSVKLFAQALGGTLTVKGKSATIKAAGEAKSANVSINIVKGVGFASAEQIVRALGGSYSWNETTKTFTVTVGNSTGGHAHH
ncbi:plastocyanin/azurin family copper-binding protein [Paenibacillus thermotolerans]|uniref:plastocyanin/azurin family copper-binding protein n=1 Tax=Paenibacillus thermotolerans TaxID=3027807 RepID=UPI0023674594|nr:MULTISPECIES: plastocyanin/azurin family copper-binding protein [unclassified Paenibacillus]